MPLGIKLSAELTSVWDALSDPAKSIMYNLPHFTAPLAWARDFDVCLTFIWKFNLIECSNSTSQLLWKRLGIYL